MTSSDQTRSVALIGARGYTGAELLRIIERHPQLTLRMAASRELAGKRVGDEVEGCTADLTFTETNPETAARFGADVFILALPNATAEPFVDAIDRHCADSVIVDLSADHRFNDDWAYGLPEHFRDAIRHAKRIANPGCYATAMQLAIRPALSYLNGRPVAFGVSGYSGAGTARNERNDPENLRENLIPYALAGHVHEREVTAHLGHRVQFHPHVASFFRGIAMTISMPLRAGTSLDELSARYHAMYDDEPLVRYGPDAPQVRDVREQPWCAVGGLTIPDHTDHAVVVATLDNLLKGAATQAVQNINLACDIDETLGLLASARVAPSFTS